MGLLNIAVGFGFQSLIAAKIGISQLADAFQWTWAVVTFGATVQLTLVTSLLIPHFQVTPEGVPTMARTRLPLLLGAIATAAQVAAALILSSGDARVLLLTSAPSHLLVAACALPLARAYIGGRFITVGAGAVANGIALLVVTAAGASTMGPQLLGTALSVGYLAQWLSTLIGIRGVAPMAPRVDTSIRLFVGVTAFTLISKLQPVLERTISLGIAEGATAALGFGQKIASGLVMIGVFGLATSTVAALSRHLSAKHWNRAGELLARNAIATFALLCAVVSIALPLSRALVVLAFQRGAFNANDSNLVTEIAVLQLPWVLAAGLTGVFTPCLYALRWYRKVLLGSVAGLLSMIGTSFALADSVPKVAVAIASSVGATVVLLAMIVIVLRSPVGPAFRNAVRIRLSLAAKSLALLATSIAAYALLVSVGAANRFWPSIVTGALLAAVSAVCFLGSTPSREQLREALSVRV